MNIALDVSQETRRREGGEEQMISRKRRCENHQISWGGQRSPAALKQAKDDEIKDDAYITASQRMGHDLS